MQSCINIACQGQDYVNIVNADAALRQDVNVAWEILVSRHQNTAVLGGMRTFHLKDHVTATEQGG